MEAISTAYHKKGARLTVATTTENSGTVVQCGGRPNFSCELLDYHSKTDFIVCEPVPTFVPFLIVAHHPTSSVVSSCGK